jgi:ferric-dicitrate binding protein FerR (iron transport regulator)
MLKIMKEEERVEYYNLIIKFFTGEISDSEMILLKSWLDRDPENRRIFNEENELWQVTSVQTKFENYKTHTAWINISSRLGLGKNNFKSFTILRKNNFRVLIAAATVACLVAIGGLSLLIAGKTSFQQMATASTIVATNEGEKAHILLADSTEIILNSGSKLQYNGHYNLEDRIVKFTGEAFFDVSTNPEKPFVVQLEQMRISATGTRFNIFSFGNEDRVETTLEEGAITVSIKGKEPVYVKSGQQVVYFVKSKNVLVRDVVTDTYTSWKENKLRFNDTPFEEVLRRIGRKYNVKFEITNRDLLNLKYTATFIDESIEEVMQMLKTVSPITYEIINRTSINDKQYLKPRIVVGKRKVI